MTSGVILLFRRLRRPLIFLIAAYAVCTLGFVLIPGVDSKGQPTHTDFLHAFYIVSYTGSTIGFGELPYAFTGAQRLWMLFTIYVTVNVWVYSIGSIVATLQDAAFRRVIHERRFINQVRRIDAPFLLVCGYGETGSVLVRELIRYGLGAVVIDSAPERLNVLGIQDLGVVVPSFPYNASHPDSLVNAGLTHHLCRGVVAVTESNEVNLAVAIAVRLLNPAIHATCLAYDTDTAANMASFKTKNVINPFAAFAQRLALIFRSPSAYVIYECLTSNSRTPLTPPRLLPRGQWIVFGYGRFGKAVSEKLVEAGNQVKVIEIDPEGTGAPLDAIRGRGTEVPTLLAAGVMDAKGIVAGSNNGIHNLAAIITARELRPGIFTIGRQYARQNDVLFQKAALDMRIQTSDLTASEAVALLRNPLLVNFLDVLKASDESWAAVVLDRFVRTIGDVSPEIWVIQVTRNLAPAIWSSLDDGNSVSVGQLMCDPRNRDSHLAVIPLLLNRDGKMVPLPSDEERLYRDDEMLFCGRPGTQNQMSWVVSNVDVMAYVQTGVERPSGWVWRLLSTWRKSDERSRAVT
jgi:Trk K+ transport system NAD-binding subunit